MSAPANGTNNVHAAGAVEATTPTVLATLNCTVAKNGAGDFTATLDEGIDAANAVMLASLNELVATTSIAMVQTDDDTFEILADADLDFSFAILNTKLPG